MAQVVIIGGGVIGLSIAYELARRDHSVTILEKETFGRKSSWAGAGIITPSNLATAIHPLEQLEALSSELHREWWLRLLSETGIDNEWIQSGGLYLARTAGEVATLAGLKQFWEDRQIDFRFLDTQALEVQFPGLNRESISEAVFVPEEYQLRNPRHLQALQKACVDLGVKLMEQVNLLAVTSSQNHFDRIEVGKETIHADYYCIAAGAWSQQLLEPLGIQILTTPVRGQIAMFKLESDVIPSIINEGSRYLVPRRDGHLLAGATVEEVGFNEATEPNEIETLVTWAASLYSHCNQQSFLKAWAGLRPGSFDAMPYLGFLSPGSNVLIATGHFKSGLHLSTGTALVMADLIEGKTASIDLAPFQPNRTVIARSL